MTALKKPRRYSIKEYLTLEENTNIKYEYHNGWIFAMAGGMPNHSRLSRNILVELDLGLRNKNCEAFNSDLKVHLSPSNSFVYPDCFVVCGELSYFDSKKTAVSNPILVIEVLSNSTESYDRGEKFRKYRALPSFREYVLINQYKPIVETFYKHKDDYWQISTAIGLDSAIYLYSVNQKIALKDLYRRVEDLQNVQTIIKFDENDLANF